jgi:hypothetical protein
MRNPLFLVPLAVVTIGFASFFIHPFGAVRAQSSNSPLLANAAITPAAAKVLERSCQNCHSERTIWPWYSYLPPVSWLIEDDVQSARSHMNLSHWEAYTAAQQIEILTKIGVEVRNRRMPLPKYLQLHPEATLSNEDVRELYAWAHDERRRLKNRSGAKPQFHTD